ncbi:MAG: winged helix-turn-helix transcriptional regulator [Pseudomonadota bacterium]
MHACLKWKLWIIYWLAQGTSRFNQLQRNLGSIPSHKRHAFSCGGVDVAKPAIETIGFLLNRNCTFAAARSDSSDAGQFFIQKLIKQPCGSWLRC